MEVGSEPPAAIEVCTILWWAGCVFGGGGGGEA